MQNPETYLEKEKRQDKRSIIVALLIVIGAALGLRWYSDTHQPPVHPLRITIIEQNIPPNPLFSISDNYSPPGALVARDNMQELKEGHEEVINDKTIWELLSIEYRASISSAWEPPLYPKSQTSKESPFELNNNSVLPYNFLNRFANRAGEWKFTVRAIRHYYDPNSKEEWQGSQNYTLTRTLQEDIKGNRLAKARNSEIAYRRARGLPEPTPLPPPGVHPIDPRKIYVAKIQWSAGQGKWQDVPQKGQKGFPLTIVGDITTGFRAVKMRPNEPWPDWTGTSGYSDILAWGGQLHPGTLIGEEVWILPTEANAISQNSDDLKTLTVSCGNIVKVSIRVMPPTADWFLS